jgi:CCR4-NOT transcription complex subunit 6
MMRVVRPLQVTFSTSGLKLESTNFVSRGGSEPPLTNKTDKFAGCLDYVFVSKGDWEVVSGLGMPYGADAPAEPADVVFPPIPNEIYPSDHLAVGCRLRFRQS